MIRTIQYLDALAIDQQAQSFTHEVADIEKLMSASKPANKVPITKPRTSRRRRAPTWHKDFASDSNVSRQPKYLLIRFQHCNGCNEAKKVS